MAAVIDAGEVVVKATYNLEGDGPLALVAYGIIRSVHASLQSAHFSSLSALCARLHPNDVNSQLQLKALGMQCVQPGIGHLMKKFVGTVQVPAQFRQQVDFFKMARFFNPVCMADQQPTPDTCVDAVHGFPSLAQYADAIGPELPLYAAAVEDIHQSAPPLAWWRRNADKLPRLSQALRIILLVQPSSAASERAFSLLNSLFQSRQERALEETVEATLMARMNQDKHCTDDLP